MIFANFINSIRSSALRQVAYHWNEAKCGKNIPAWSDIRPAQICTHLPIIWAYKFDRNTGEFTARLAGDRISQVFGKSFRGLPLADAQPPEAYPSIYALFERVLLEPALYVRQGHVFEHLGRTGRGERIVLPLSSDGAHGDGILGATEYHSSNSEDSAHVVSDTEEWVPIRLIRTQSN